MSTYLKLGNKGRERRARVFKSSTVIKDYPTVLCKHDFELPQQGLSLEQQNHAWTKLHDYLYAHKSNMLGYQHNQDFHCNDILKDYLNMHINNSGDPFKAGYYGINTKAMECAVLDYFAKLWNISLRDEDNNNEDVGYWGYVVSMGCTEANMYALYNARDYLSGKPILYNDKKQSPKINYTDTEPKDCGIKGNPNCFTPVVFHSENAHTSLGKAAHLLNISTFPDLGSGHFPCPLVYPDDYPRAFAKDSIDQTGWPFLVPVDADGSMYLPSLTKLISAFASRGYPPIVIFTSGVTFKGSYDNVQAAINELVPILKENHLYQRCVYHSSSENSPTFDVRHGFWFHVDGALGAAHLPFLEMSINKGKTDVKFPAGFPVFDFRIPEVMSISMSLHKWFGCPFPAGIYMTRRKNQMKPPTNPFYTGCEDTTFAGSRNGHGVIIVWDFLSKKSYHYLTEEAVKAEKIVSFLFKKFQDLEKDLGEDLWLSRSPGTLMVCFKQPREDIVLKYSLACDKLLVETKQGGLERRLYSHISVMPHVQEDLIERIMNELMSPGAFPAQDVEVVSTL